MLTLIINTDLLLWIAIIVLLVVILIYSCWDVHYFICMLLAQWWAKMFQTRLKLDETSTLYGFCTTADSDLSRRGMSKARYARELDFARLNFCERTGIRLAITKVPIGTVLQTVNLIRYVNDIPLLSFYKVTTKLVHWDQRVLYLEHRFISMDERLVYATAMCKLNVLGLNIHNVLCDLSGYDASPLPPKCDSVDSFYKCISASSHRLRQIELALEVGSQ